MRDKSDRFVIAWWATLGVGLGLLVLGGLLWTYHPGGAQGDLLTRDLERAGPLMAQLQAGQEPSPELMAGMGRSGLTVLLQALSEASRQRRQALVAYQAQIEAVALGEGLTPAHLADPAGRMMVRQKLGELRQALDGLARQDAHIQKSLDAAVATWLKDTPHWGDEGLRQSLLSSSRMASAAMGGFFKVEGDIVSQVEGLLAHLDTVGPGVTMEASPQPELVFAKASDLMFYRQTLSQLGDLGRREQQLLADAQRAGGVHAKRVGELLTASLDVAGR